jgi:hypothetical protein
MIHIADKIVPILVNRSSRIIRRHFARFSSGLNMIGADDLSDATSKIVKTVKG